MTTQATATKKKELTRDEMQAEWLKCRKDFRYYLRTYVKVQDRTSKSTIPWEWWPDVHESGVDLLLTYREIVVLKARQISWSWLLVAYASWMALFHENAGVLVLSQGQLEANQFLDKVKFVLDNLPPFMQPSRSVNNESEIVFAVMKSQIQALPATQNAGRGSTASLIIVDEAAFHPYAAINYVAYKPAIDAGGQLILVSTANGAGNFFHTMYMQAKAGLSGFTARFYSWRTRPGRVDEWLERQRLALRAAGKERELAQEYPASDAEAFLVSGNLRFDRDALKVHYDQAEQRSPLPAHIVLNAIPGGVSSEAARVLAPLLQSGQLKVWRLPQVGVGYVVGSDPAEGLDGRDFSCSTCLEARSLEHVWTLHGHWTPANFTKLTAALAWWYNTALWGIERNNHGGTCIHVADQELRYPRLYWHEDKAQQTDKQRYNNGGALPPRKLGWPTTTGTKPGLIDDLDEVITSFALHSPDVGFWGEAMTYIINARGGTEAGEGSHDDRVMAMAITRRMAQQPGAGTARPMLPQGGQLGAGGQAGARPGTGKQDTTQYSISW
jgi:hypothetical protein